MKTAGFPNFEGLVTLTLDRVILHTVVHHSSKKLFVDGHLRPTLLGRLRTVNLTSDNSGQLAAAWTSLRQVQRQNLSATIRTLAHSKYTHLEYVR